jgi:hypothetical protein
MTHQTRLRVGHVWTGGVTRKPSTRQPSSRHRQRRKSGHDCQPSSSSRRQYHEKATQKSVGESERGVGSMRIFRQLRQLWQPSAPIKPWFAQQRRLHVAAATCLYLYMRNCVYLLILILIFLMTVRRHECVILHVCIQAYISPCCGNVNARTCVYMPVCVPSHFQELLMYNGLCIEMYIREM